MKSYSLLNEILRHLDGWLSAGVHIWHYGTKSGSLALLCSVQLVVYVCRIKAHTASQYIPLDKGDKIREHPGFIIAFLTAESMNQRVLHDLD